MNTQILFVMNRHNNTAAPIKFSCWEELQGAFRVGIMLPDGTSATGIGRCKSMGEFVTKAAHGKTKVLVYEDYFPGKLEIQVNGSWVEVSPYIFRSYSGERRIDGKAFNAPVFVLGTEKIAV